jgi:uncharacterized protein
MNMKTTLLLALLSLLCLMATTSTFAIKVDTLYSAKIPVNTQSEQERLQSMPHAMEQVLIKVSGNSQILNNPAIQSRLNEGGKLVQEFTYTNTPNNKYPFLLELHFDNNEINQWLRDAAAPIWGQNRPLILSLITQTVKGHPTKILSSGSSTGHPTEILSSGSSDERVTLLTQQAERRGLPIIFPLMDLTDITEITTQDITSQHMTNNINLAAKRYGSDALLFGSITQDQEIFSSHWKLILDNAEWEWNLTGPSEANILSTLIDNMTDTLSGRFAIITTNQIQNSLQLKIVGIHQQSDFVQLIRYLNHLTPVANVNIVEIMGNEITLKISLRSTQASFIQAIALGKQLTPVPLAHADTTSLLIYQWNAL